MQILGRRAQFCDCTSARAGRWDIFREETPASTAAYHLGKGHRTSQDTGHPRTWEGEELCPQSLSRHASEAALEPRP